MLYNHVGCLPSISLRLGPESTAIWISGLHWNIEKMQEQEETNTFFFTFYQNTHRLSSIKHMHITHIQAHLHIIHTSHTHTLTTHHTHTHTPSPFSFGDS